MVWGEGVSQDKTTLVTWWFRASVLESHCLSLSDGFSPPSPHGLGSVTSFLQALSVFMCDSELITAVPHTDILEARLVCEAFRTKYALHIHPYSYHLM